MQNNDNNKDNSKIFRNHNLCVFCYTYDSEVWKTLQKPNEKISKNVRKNGKVLKLMDSFVMRLI